MPIGPFKLIRLATPGQRRTLLAASMGWALDAFDAMLYSLVLAMLMRDLGDEQNYGGIAGHADPAGLRNWGRAVRLSWPIASGASTR